MTDRANLPLSELRRQYLASSTIGMPIAGMIIWAAIGVVALMVPTPRLALITLIGMGLIFPLSLLVDRVRGAQGLSAESRANPITGMFMRSIFIITLLAPFVIIAARATGDANLVVLGMAILAGIVWIPHGWGADDPSGLIHAIVRSVGCYAAFLLAPEALRASAICGVVVLCYVYILVAMKKPGSAA